MAMAWPKKKEIIHQKRDLAKQKEQDQKEETCTRVTEKTIEKINKQTKRTEETQPALESIGLTAVIRIRDAHIHNIIEPGSYSRRLNQTLTENNIHPIELETPESEKTSWSSNNRRNNSSNEWNRKTWQTEDNRKTSRSRIW